MASRLPRNLIRIHDVDDPHLFLYRSLKGKHLEREGICIAEGIRVIDALLDSGLAVESCLATERHYAMARSRIRALEKRSIPLYCADRKIVETIIGLRFHQGIMVAARCPEKRPIRELIDLWKKPYRLVALNGVNDPENVGLIVRNAAAFGCTALVADTGSYDPFYRKAVRVSIGSVFKLPIAYESDLAATLRWLKKHHKTKIIVSSPEGRTTSPHRVSFSGNVCVVFGNEDSGVSSAVRRAADIVVKIPTTKVVDSLNVAASSAILLHHAYQTRS